MRKNVLRCLLVPALFCAAPARAQVPGVDCAGTLVAWSYSYPWYAENCYCASPNTYPVCPSGGTGGSDTSLPGQGGYYDFNRISPFGPASGESFFTLRYGDSFSDWQEEAMARWRSYLIRNRLAKAGIFVTPNNPAASLIEWFYKVFSSFNKTKEQPASLFATLDNSPVDKASSNFEANYVDPEFFLKDDPAIGPLAGNMAEVESNEQDIGGRCAPEGSIAPGFRMRYSSLFGGQYETVGLKIEQFPDGRAVFTDSADTRWTFRPYAGAATGYYRPPLGSPYRLARDKHSWRVETPDGDTIEFAPATQPDQWRPSRYNSADGSWLTYNYGPNGLARITDMHGRYFAFERNAQGLPLTITDQTGKKTTFTYDAQGRAIAVTYPDGFKKTFGYDTAGFMTSVKNGLLAGERYTYDSTGRVLTSESEGGVNRLEHFYNDVSSKTVITDAFANKTEYSYINEYGRKLATGVTDALGGKAALTYDANYNIASATDQLGRVTRYVRNANGDPETITDALGNGSTIQYQVKLNYQDASGEHTDYYSRPIKITDALGRLTRLDYDSYGNLANTEDALGNKTSMDYDKAGHMLELRDAMGAAYKYEYSMGLAKSVDPLGRVTKYKRDADLHVTQLTDPLGCNTTFTYDLSGNVISVTNPANFVTRFAYGNGACPSCGGSQLSALTDPKGNSWTFGYDAYGRLTNTANPLGQAKAYQYDKMSRVTEVKDPAGNITVHTYDALNRLTRRDIQTPSGEHAVTDYIYDKVGNLLNVSNAGGMVSFTYDALNRPVKTEQLFGGRSYAIAYAYDAVGNRTAMSTPWGKYSYTYDLLNRLAGIVNPQGINVTFGYDAVGRRTSKKIFKTTPEVIAEADYTYDAAGELLSITNKAGGKTIAFDKYQYDAAGNRVLKEDQNGATKYRYDASNRLITAVPVPMYMPEAEAFVYDRNGNRRYDRGAFDYKYDAANRLLYNSTYTYTHDLNGNLTSRTNKNDNTTITYTYNPEQQLDEVVTPQDKVEYKYDPLGRRTEKTVNGNIQRYVYDNEDIIAILDGSNNPMETFTHGPGIDEPLILTKADRTNYYYHADGLGSIVALTDENNEMAETYSYKAYGQPTIKDRKGTVFDISPIGNPYLFTARELDSESGLYYFRARYYDWHRGAFTQEDPIGFVGSGLNLFAYAVNSPSNYLDPFGLKCKKPFWDRASENFTKTNQIIPGLTAPPGLGLALGASKTVAQTTGLITAGQWLLIGLKGASLGPATFTALETGVLAGVNSLYATAIVSLSYEVGVGVGSILSALIYPCEEEVCSESRGP